MEFLLVNVLNNQRRVFFLGGHPGFLSGTPGPGCRLSLRSRCSTALAPFGLPSLVHFFQVAWDYSQAGDAKVNTRMSLTPASRKAVQAAAMVDPVV